MDQSRNRPLTHGEHVVDHRLGRSDFSVAVMPCEFRDVEKIEGDRRPLLAEDGNKPCFPFATPLRPTHSHTTIVARIPRLRDLPGDDRLWRWEEGCGAMRGEDTAERRCAMRRVALGGVIGGLPGLLIGLVPLLLSST